MDFSISSLFQNILQSACIIIAAYFLFNKLESLDQRSVSGDTRIDSLLRLSIPAVHKRFTPKLIKFILLMSMLQSAAVFLSGKYDVISSLFLSIMVCCQTVTSIGLGICIGLTVNVFTNADAIQSMRQELFQILRTRKFEDGLIVDKVTPINFWFSAAALKCSTKSGDISVDFGSKNVNPNARFCIIKMKDKALFGRTRKVLLSEAHFQMASPAQSQIGA